MPVKQSERVQEKIRTSELLRVYGGLLSEKQAEILRMYFDEDLGFSEIAEELGITRQAVYDATRQGTSTLERFERHLGLVEKQQPGGDAPGSPAVKSARQPVSASSPAPDSEEARRIFATLEKVAGEDIIYDTRRLRLRLKELKGKLWP